MAGPGPLFSWLVDMPSPSRGQRTYGPNAHTRCPRMDMSRLGGPRSGRPQVRKMDMPSPGSPQAGNWPLQTPPT